MRDVPNIPKEREAFVSHMEQRSSVVALRDARAMPRREVFVSHMVQRKCGDHLAHNFQRKKMQPKGMYQ